MNIETIREESVNFIKHRFRNELGGILTFKEVIQLWIENEPFRIFYNQTLAKSKFQSFYWEHPPMTQGTLNEVYQFILHKGSFSNSAIPEPEVFKKYFIENDQVVSFWNLGRDAKLVVPMPLPKHSEYTHLAIFVRMAPAIQIDKFWKRVGEEYLSELTATKKWLNTAGQGVFWLHIRIDKRPKYYKHKEYANW